ncbi:LuxR C-terminal-related transcriptional regulator [Trujillonella humicola]|uniref:LuxR C-terminal-related transcriptional regulator n=1 Tax=Trujillonella humicola TaxID=3383699 RepID=UPI003906C034
MAGDVLERGREASGRFRWDEAYALYRAAAENEPLGAQDLAALADAAWWLGHTEESLALSEQVYRRHLHGAQVPQAAMLAIEIGFLWMLRGEPTVGSGWISRAKRLLEDAPESAAHGYLSYLDVEGALGAGRYEEAIERSRAMQQLADRHDDPTLCAVALVLEGGAQVRRGRVTSGLAVIDEAMLPVRAGQVAPNWAGNLYCHVMDLFFELADLDRARAWTRATERWCDEHSNAAMSTGICRVHRAHLHHLEGRWTAAAQEAATACRDLADMNVGVVAEGHYRIAELHRLRGRHRAAQEHFTRAHELGRDPQPGLALLRLAEGRGATAALRSALASADRDLDRVPLLLAQAQVALACRQSDVTALAAGELDRLAGTFQTPGLLACAAEAVGLARLARGEAAEALPVLREAWRRWRDLEVPYDAARMRVRRAQALAGVDDGEAAAHEVEAARAVFVELGAVDDLRGLDGVLGSGEPPGGLSAREVQVLRAVCAGRTNRQIATALTLSEKTVARHLSNIFAKLDVASRTEAAAVAFRHGLADPSEA